MIYYWYAGVGIMFASLGIGALAAFVMHRREKSTRPPHAPDRNMWSGT